MMNNSSWEIKRLDDVCEVEYGTRVVNKRDGGTTYPVYGGGEATFFMDTFNRENCFVIARFAMSEQCTRFGEGETFSDYGKLYDREFEVWYCDIGSKDKKDIQKFYDRKPLHYEPKDRQRDMAQTSIQNNINKMRSEITGGRGVFRKIA